MISPLSTPPEHIVATGTSPISRRRTAVRSTSSSSPRSALRDRRARAAARSASTTSSGAYHVRSLSESVSSDTSTSVPGSTARTPRNGVHGPVTQPAAIACSSSCGSASRGAPAASSARISLANHSAPPKRATYSGLTPKRSRASTRRRPRTSSAASPNSPLMRATASSPQAASASTTVSVSEPPRHARPPSSARSSRWLNASPL